VLEVQDNYVLVQWPRKQAFRNDRQWNDAFTIDHSFSFDIPTVINGEGRIQPHINFFGPALEEKYLYGHKPKYYLLDTLTINK
jgi:hypothetical protein